MMFKVGDRVKPSKMLVSSHWPIYQQEGETPGKTRARVRKWRGTVTKIDEPIGNLEFYRVTWDHGPKGQGMNQHALESAGQTRAKSGGVPTRLQYDMLSRGNRFGSPDGPPLIHPDERAETSDATEKSLLKRGWIAWHPEEGVLYVTDEGIEAMNRYSARSVRKSRAKRKRGPRPTVESSRGSIRSCIRRDK